MDNTAKQFSSRIEEVWESKVTLSAAELTKIIDMAYSTRSKWTICVVGESGIGKSMIPETYANKNGIGFINLKGSGLLPEDIRGFGTMRRDIDTRWLRAPSVDPGDRLASAVEAYVKAPVHYAFNLMPQLAQAFEPGWKGILFLDEFAQASREVQDVYFQLIYDRRIDEKVLSDDVIVMTAMNPPGLSEYALNPLTKAAEDRLEFYVYKPVYTEWCTWAESYGIHPDIISFVRNNPSCFEDNKGRRLHNLSDRLSAMHSMGIDSHRLIVAAATACLGGGYASSFVKFMSGVTINSTDILGFRENIEDSIRKLKSLQDDKRVSAISSLNRELVSIVSQEKECIRIAMTSIDAVRKSPTQIARSKSAYVLECIEARNAINETSSDETVAAFVARVILYYAFEMYEKNGDIMVSFMRDLSTKAWSTLKDRLNELMRRPEYSSMVKEVIRCQLAAKKSSEA